MIALIKGKAAKRPINAQASAAAGRRFPLLHRLDVLGRCQVQANACPPLVKVAAPIPEPGQRRRQAQLILCCRLDGPQSPAARRLSWSASSQSSQRPVLGCAAVVLLLPPALDSRRRGGRRLTLLHARAELFHAYVADSFNMPSLVSPSRSADRVRRLCSSSAVTAVSTSPRHPQLHTTSIASSVAPFTNTPRRAKTRCSRPFRSRKLQSSVARSVCWRAGKSRALRR